MKVINILISDRGIFIEELIKELIDNNISYVQVDNEVHFLDKIYRFYEREDMLKNKQLFDNLIDVIDSNTYGKMINVDFSKAITTDFQKLKHNYNYETKKTIKNQNRLIKRKINPRKKGI